MPSVPTLPTDSNAAPSKAGITTTEDGQRHIPSSVRPDGSLRKEIRIRPGYRPPEDVEVYKNRTTEAWKNRGKGGIPGAESLGSQTKDTASSASSAANKNAKRREARKKAATEKTANDSTSQASEKKEGNSKEPEVKDEAAEKEKEARKLTKKLRQARELKDKKEQGAALLPEQFEKVIRINELIRQLNALGFDADGEKKEPEAT
jgi:partner of Y14 and mago protein